MAVDAMFEVRRMDAVLGAEVEGLDLSRPLSADAVASVSAALVEHKVLFFRDQAIGAADHLRFASCFGPPQAHPVYPHVDGFPEVSILASDRENRSKIEKWHTDMTFKACPPLGSVLRARVVPERGGDTQWLSLEAAWATLPSDLREYLAPLKAEHSFEHGFKESLAEPGGRERLAAALGQNPPVAHPVMRTHPVDGRPCLFVNSLFTTRILGIDAAESEDMLARLFEHIENGDYQCRFRWQVDSIAFWDNRATQHRPADDWWPATRRHERVTVSGDRPV
jgi:taurine dioxygenase